MIQYVLPFTQMIKQPKYFISRDLPVKTALVPKLVDQPKASFAVPIPRTLAILAAYRNYILVMVAVVSLLGLGVLGFAPYVRSKALAFPLPTFPASQRSSTIVSQSAPINPGGLTYDVKIADARVEIVKTFLERYDSPLKPAEQYAQLLVDSADRYDLDYRLLPAIMMQESNLCKMSKPELKNCFGFGIRKEMELGFDSYEASFDRVARELKERYIDIGLTTPEQIMTKYTPSSNGSWAASVNQWIAEMEHNNRAKGIASEADANLLEYTKL